MRQNDGTVSVGRPRSHGVGERVDSAAHKQRVVSLFEAHNSALIRFLSIRLHSEEEAQEIAQDAYVKADDHAASALELLGLDEPDAINHFRAYLFKVAANLAKDRLKQRDRRSRLRERPFADDETSSPPPDFWHCKLPSNSPSYRNPYGNCQPNAARPSNCTGFII